MANHNTSWPALGFAFTRSNDGRGDGGAGGDGGGHSDGGGRGDGGGRENGSSRGNGKGGRAFQASNFDQGQQISSPQLPLTTEQLDRLYKLLGSPTPSCSIATKGNQKIKIADGSFSAIAGKGSVVLSPMLTLKNDLNSGKMIGSAKESGGLYYLDIGSASQLPSK
ncbi:ATP-dependent RNA helicase DBP2-like [Vicia villosa]|uniref:ATP-dependent RNA helicase DBP2-like n=1 Tax=Vicia villosa TaxID=3911 RepID=UPI00273CAE51|nr:ATP-dependent RNA helicase DBP2-like [Vicia villosa]